MKMPMTEKDAIGDEGGAAREQRAHIPLRSRLTSASTFEELSANVDEQSIANPNPGCPSGTQLGWVSMIDIDEVAGHRDHLESRLATGQEDRMFHAGVAP
jgi:hypothetical protein